MSLQSCREEVEKVINGYVGIFGARKEVKTNADIIKILNDNNVNLDTMFLVSDMCYNKTNKANLKSYPNDIILFEYVKRGQYYILGSNYNYTGDVIWTDKSGKDVIVGRWINGTLDYWGESKNINHSDRTANKGKPFEVIRFLGDKRNVQLINKLNDRKAYVRKEYTVYNYDVFSKIKDSNMTGVPKLYELNLEGNKLVTIEEYLQGESLEEYVQNKGTLGDREIRFVATEMCKILRQFHKLTPPLIHRDIKPANIILTKEGRLYLVDFNATKELHSNATEDTVFGGTDGFAAPEQRGSYGQSSPAADIYGLGATLSYLMTGVKANSFVAPGRFEKVLSKCLEFDPKNRYQSIDEFEEAFLKAW